MKKLRVIIVDDESLARKLLRSYLSEIADIELIAECENGSQAIEVITHQQPDLMFLDIQMPGLDGFDVIKRLQAEAMPLVVFVTAYDQYALKAFDVHAVDYILKPLDEQSVKRAVKRCRMRSRGFDENDNTKPSIIAAFNHIKQKKVSDNRHAVPAESSVKAGSTEQRQKIVIKDGGAITLLAQSDIEWVDAAGDYMCLHAGGATHIMRSTMKNLLKQLNKEKFKRVHRSTIVNSDRIERIIPHTKGEYFVELNNKQRIKVSRKYRSVIKAFISKFDQPLE